MGLMCFITSPVAAFLGAITSVIVTKIARRQIPEDELYRVGLLTGGVTGTVMGIAAAWLMFSLF